MKKLIFVFVSCLLLAGCSVAAAQPTATILPTITSTVTPAYTPTPISDPNILFQDDFSDDESGWWVGSLADGYSHYVEGKYIISARETQPKNISVYEDKPLVDGVFSTEYRIISGDEENTGVVLYWHVRDKGSRYFLQIWGNGYYTLGKYVDSKMSQITGKRKSPLINPGDANNRVTIAVNGDNADIYFNDNYETSITDSSIKYGDIGLGVFPSHSSAIEAEFDNVAVYQYDPGSPYTPIKPEVTPIPAFRSITWQELADFLSADHTNWNEYTLDVYDCTNFSIELVENARKQNLKAWNVWVKFEGKKIGHDFVAIETSDRGIVFIEPQGDNTYSYVEIGNNLCDDWGKYRCFGVVRKIDFKDCDRDVHCTPYVP